MATFGEEQEKTSGKMSDLVMEYVSQFIARDFLEAYERARSEERYEFVPAEFDEKIYKKISKLNRKKTGQNIKLIRLILLLAIAAVCAVCIFFTAMVLSNSMVRDEVLQTVFPFLGRL